MVSLEVRTYFEQQGERLQARLREATGDQELQVEVFTCPGSEDGLHLRAKGDKLDFEDHLWQQDEYEFIVDVLDFCFERLFEHLRHKRLRKMGFAVVVYADAPTFVPAGARNYHLN